MIVSQCISEISSKYRYNCQKKNNLITINSGFVAVNYWFIWEALKFMRNTNIFKKQLLMWMEFEWNAEDNFMNLLRHCDAVQLKAYTGESTITSFSYWWKTSKNSMNFPFCPLLVELVRLSVGRSNFFDKNLMLRFPTVRKFCLKVPFCIFPR